MRFYQICFKFPSENRKTFLRNKKKTAFNPWMRLLMHFPSNIKNFPQKWLFSKVVCGNSSREVIDTRVQLHQPSREPTPFVNNLIDCVKSSTTVFHLYKLPPAILFTILLTYRVMHFRNNFIPEKFIAFHFTTEVNFAFWTGCSGFNDSISFTKQLRMKTPTRLFHRLNALMFIFIKVIIEIFISCLHTFPLSERKHLPFCICQLKFNKTAEQIFLRDNLNLFLPRITLSIFWEK